MSKWQRMIKMNNEQKAYYNNLFTEEDKIKAFDKIAEHYYFANFGSMSKSDFETLMFSIYIEQILKNNDNDFIRYSDYKLSKELGITQSRISNLKIKKQLQYPHEFDWKKSFTSVCKNMLYENGKIKVQIPDVNLFYEIKNAVEVNGGYIEMTFTRNLLQIPIEYFLDLLVIVSDDEDRSEIRKCIRKKIRDNNKDKEFIERESIGKQLKKYGKEFVCNIVNTTVSDIVSGNLQIANDSVKVIAQLAAKILPKANEDESD